MMCQIQSRILVRPGIKVNSFCTSIHYNWVVLALVVQAKVTKTFNSVNLVMIGNGTILLNLGVIDKNCRVSADQFE